MYDHPLYHLVFSHQLRAVYCPIPKAACSSWKSLFRTITGLPQAGVTVIHDRRRNGLTYAWSVERFELMRILFAKSAGYFKFTVCRNPYARLHSSYCHIIAEKPELSDDVERVALRS